MIVLYVLSYLQIQPIIRYQLSKCPRLPIMVRIFVDLEIKYNQNLKILTRLRKSCGDIRLRF